MSLAFDVFISSPRPDRRWVSDVVDALAKEGVSAWAETQVKPGQVWAEEMRKALELSRYMVFVISSRSVNANWRALELGLVLGTGKPVIPIVPNDISIDEVPGPLRAREFLAKTDPELVAKEIKRVVRPLAED